ncbi:MAG: dTDP-glucose 4,6-dehydratase, partial [Thermoprotei archaeon]
MRLLVTGGLGFIGSNFIRFILDKYDDVNVVNLDNLSYGSNLNNLKDLISDNRYEFVKGDIKNKKLIKKLIKSKDVDVIVNFAAQSHVDRSISNPMSFYKDNVGGVLSILEAIRESKMETRLVHIGTDEVYGDILIGSFKEDSRLKPSSPYSASKAAADLFCLAYHRTYDLDIVISRCTNNFGPYQFPEKFIPKTIIRSYMGLKIPIYGSGKNIRDWIYVLDYCDALDRIINKGKPGEIYNVSAGNEFDNLTIAKKILEIMGKNEEFIEFVEDRPGHDIRYSLDSEKIKNELGWRPKHDFNKALEETVKWYISNEW